MAIGRRGGRCQASRDATWKGSCRALDACREVDWYGSSNGSDVVGDFDGAPALPVYRLRLYRAILGPMTVSGFAVESTHMKTRVAWSENSTKVGEAGSSAVQSGAYAVEAYYTYRSRNELQSRHPIRHRSRRYEPEQECYRVWAEEGGEFLTVLVCPKDRP